MGLVAAAAPQAWLELLGMDYVSEDLVRANRDIGLMLIGLALGGFFVLWNGPRRQRPMLTALWFATMGLTGNIWLGSGSDHDSYWTTTSRFSRNSSTNL